MPASLTKRMRNRHSLLKKYVPVSRIHPVERDGSAGNNKSQAGNMLLAGEYLFLKDKRWKVENCPGPKTAMAVVFHRIDNIPCSHHVMLKSHVFINMGRSLVKHRLWG